MMLNLDELLSILRPPAQGVARFGDKLSLRIWTPTEAPFFRTEHRKREDGGPIIVRYNESNEIVAVDFPAEDITNPPPTANAEGWTAITWSDLVDRLDGLEDDGVPPREALFIAFVPLPFCGCIGAQEWKCFKEFSVIVDLNEAGDFLAIEFA
jgi:hypothetical protein